MAGIQDLNRLIQEIEGFYDSLIVHYEQKVASFKGNKSKSAFYKPLLAAKGHRKILSDFQLLPEDLSREESLSVASTVFRSITSLHSHVRRKFKTRSVWIKSLRRFKRISKSIVRKLRQKPIPPPRRRWIEFVYIWAVETNDPNIGKRNLELHFKSQAESGNNDKIIDLSEHIFMRLIEHPDLKFLKQMDIVPFTGGEFINGLRTDEITEPMKVSFKLELKDEDYGFSRVDKAGFLPKGWWDLPKEEVWGLVKAGGITVILHRGKKGRLRKGQKSTLQKIKQGRQTTL